jgi:hypothetical protein
VGAAVQTRDVLVCTVAFGLILAMLHEKPKGGKIRCQGGFSCKFYTARGCGKMKINIAKGQICKEKNVVLSLDVRWQVYLPPAIKFNNSLFYPKGVFKAQKK